MHICNSETSGPREGLKTLNVLSYLLISYLFFGSNDCAMNESSLDLWKNTKTTEQSY